MLTVALPLAVIAAILSPSTTVTVTGSPTFTCTPAATVAVGVAPCPPEQATYARADEDIRAFVTCAGHAPERVVPVLVPAA